MKRVVEGEIVVTEAQDYCTRHGWYKNKKGEVKGLYVETACPRCSGEVVAANEDDRVVELSRKSLIPKRFKNKTLAGYSAESPDQKKAFNICSAYAEGFEDRYKQGGGLVMCGRPGTGKTHLSCAIANYVIETFAMQAVYMTVIEALRKVKDTYGTAQSEQVVIDGFCKPKLLILDEVGVQFGTDTEKMILFEIMDNRYKEMKPTILISNLSFDELHGYVGDRVMDRMKEGGGAIIGFGWSSYRQQAA